MESQIRGDDRIGLNLLILIIFEVLRQNILGFRGHTDKYLGVKGVKERE